MRTRLFLDPSGVADICANTPRCLLPALFALAVWLTPRELVTAQDSPVQQQPDVAVSPTGPIHEAYAQPGLKNPQPAPVVPNKPPEPVPEQPPAEKPQGENVQWISGYWSWDAPRNDFIWVSGFWRQPPPGRKWLRGTGCKQGAAGNGHLVSGHGYPLVIHSTRRSPQPRWIRDPPSRLRREYEPIPRRASHGLACGCPN
jgi:hypothetical protein